MKRLKYWPKEEFRQNLKDASQQNLIGRLEGITQIWTFPKKRLTTNRLSHSKVLRKFVVKDARELGLSETLCDAAGLLHDTGHLPFGHEGEFFEKDYLDDLTFSHASNGVRLCAIFGIQLNPLLAETIARHSDGDAWINHEFADDEYEWVLSKVLVAIWDDIACYSDLADIAMESIPHRGNAIAYMNQVLAIAKAPLLSDNPSDKELQKAFYDILEAYSCDIIAQSKGKNGIFMSEEYFQAFKEMKKFVYNKFHKSPEIVESRGACIAKLAVVQEKIEKIIASEKFEESNLANRVFDFLTKVNYSYIKRPPLKRIVVDFVSTCTDRDIIDFYEEIYGK